MKCTECGRELRPVVAIDIDGTLGDFHGHFIKFIVDYLGYNGTGDLYNGRMPMKQWFIRRWWQTSELGMKSSSHIGRAE